MKAFRNNLFALRLVFSICPSYFVLTLLVALTGVTAPLTGVLGIMFLIDALTAKNARTAFIIILAYGLITAATSVFRSWYESVYEPAAKTRISSAFCASLLGKTGQIDLASLENSTFYDQYNRAVSEANIRAQGVVQTLCGLIGNLFSMATLTAILMKLDAFVLLLTGIGAALMFFLNLKRSRLSFSQYLERTQLERQIQYIQRVYYEPQYTREIRLFDMNPFMMKRYKEYFRELQSMLKRQGLRLWFFNGLEKLLNDCFYVVITLFYLTIRFFAGAVTIGGLTALFNGIFQFGDQIYSLLSRMLQLQEHCLYLDTVKTVLQTPSVIETTEGMMMDSSRPHSIELRHVTFAYPGQEPILRDFNLKIEAGEHVALLGRNGAGKSTLINLMLRYYDPQEGQILIDGEDIKHVDIRSLRSCYGVVLQDFRHFAFSIADNIALGRQVCLERVDAAIGQAGLSEWVHSLPSGAMTPITREFDDKGVCLSGGAYQKLALARAYAQDSGILLFDEPSSALDPIAEHELFCGLKTYAQNKTVLFVCHKMSLGLYADRVVLLDKGKIIEQGPPAQLLEEGGLFSRLYDLQAEGV